MDRLVQTDRMGTVTQIIPLYSSCEQISISDHTVLPSFRRYPIIWSASVHLPEIISSSVPDVVKVTE